MGFYGRVTKSDTANFTIDKTYPNRKTMEEQVNSDGIFVGRYVLIEYEPIGKKSYVRLYKNPDNDCFYFSGDYNPETRARFTNDLKTETHPYCVEANEIVYILDDHLIQHFYQVIGFSIDTEENVYYADFKLLEEPPADVGSYYENYSIDINEYGNSRGFDSTVWQKIYQDEEEKYVMIAELNSVVPTFSITLDPPTLNPIPPHFDSDSTNVYYKLHLQPSWGFKVKEADQDGGLSDIDISATISKWDPVNKIITGEKDEYKGAIYFNRNGFDPNYHYVANDEPYELKDNFIQVSTESSGYPYNQSHKNESLDDIQALEIMLPGIGKTISDLWDLAYGKGESIKEDDTKKLRNTDVSWDNLKGLRLVQTSNDPNNSGFEYDIENVSTLAGCINSVHDLMGMIIVNNNNKNYATEEDEIKAALVNRIYYRDGEYWFKNITYTYPGISNEEQIIPNMTQFDNNYYYKNEKNYYLEQEGYQAGNQYYRFNDDVIKEVDLCEKIWLPNTFYYKLENGDYKLDSNKWPDENITYYEIEIDWSKLTGYVNNSLGRYNKCFFPTSYSQETYEKLFPTVKATTTTQGKGLFYQATQNGKHGYFPFEQGKISYQDSTAILYYWDGYTIEISTTTDGKIIETYDFNKATVTEVHTVPFVKNTFYYQDYYTKDWVLLEKEEDINLNEIYYPFGENGVQKIPVEGKFYEPNLYYYKDNVNYLIDTNDLRKPGIKYYTINEKGIQQVADDVIFYEPNKYFYKDKNGNPVLDTNTDMTPGRTYYKDIYTLYVSPDSTNKELAPGSIWNPLIDEKDAPEGIILSNREEKYEWKHLNGFSRTLNTINGLILKINNLLRTDDILTRDTQTVQGCINKINDIIDLIGNLKPSHFIAVDEYGRMTSMQQETDKWINVDINGNNNDKVIITHEFTRYSGTGADQNGNTNSSSNMNGAGDTVKLYTPHVDEKGHVIGSNIETVTLPFGYKTIKDSNTTVGSTVATSTQDTLTLEGDSWILPTVSQGKINYTHTGPVVGTARNENNITPAFGGTFTIEDWSFDEKGHKSQLSTHTVKIPQGSLSDTTKTGSDIITQLSFNATTGALSTTRENISTIKLTGFSQGESSTDIDATSDTVGSALGKLQKRIINEETNRAADVKAKYDALNTALEESVNNLNQSISNSSQTLTKYIDNIADELQTAIDVEAEERNKAIQNLDVEAITTETYEVFATISETNGKVAATKKNIGTLTLNGFVIGDGSNAGVVNDTDSINNAFAKVQNQLNLQNASINALTQKDTLHEKSIGQLQGDFSRLEDQFGQFNADTEQNIENLSNDINYIQKDLQDFVSINIYNQLSEKVTALEQQIKALEELVNSLIEPSQPGE